MASSPCHTPPFVPYHGNYAHASKCTFPSQFDVHKNYSISPCLRCTELCIEAGNLRARIAGLDAQLMKVQNEKADADNIICFLLRINCEKDVSSTVNDPSRNDSDLSRKLFQANIEKDCLKVMLDHALKENVDLRVRLLGLQNSRPYACQDLLGDYLGSSEVHEATDGGKDSLSAVVNNKAPEHHKSTQDADYLSDSSYIFHFVGENKDPKNTINEDKIIFTREKISEPENPIPQMDVNLTSENSTTSNSLGAPIKPVELSSVEPILSNQPPATLTTSSSGSKKLVQGNLSKPNASCAKHSSTAHSSKRTTGSDFCDRTLRYNPVAGTCDVFRTLVISNIPHEATMMAVLDQVRGGVVVDAKLLQTSSITGANTAIVIFLHERTAVAFEAHAKKNPIVINNQTAVTTLLRTPTWPTSSLTQKAGFDGTPTRCLKVSNYPRRISPSELCRKFQVNSPLKWDRIEHMVLRDDDVLIIRFQSMAEAVIAKGKFEAFRDFRDCVTKFAPDPCAQPLRDESDAEKDHTIKIVAMKESMRADDVCKAEFPPASDEGRLSMVEMAGPLVASRGRGCAKKV